MKFSPTPEQIKAAQKLYVAIAFHMHVKNEFEKWEQELLNTGTFHFDECYYEGPRANQGIDFPQDKIIRDPDYVFCISGLSLIETPEYTGTDADRYYTALRTKAIAGRLKEGEGALSMAESDVYRLENVLIDLTYGSLHHINRNDIDDPEDREQLATMLVDMFADVVVNDELNAIQKEYYHERMLPNEPVKEVFTDTEESFTRFQSKKKYTPILEFLPMINREPQEVEGIEGVLSYMPNCIIFQMKQGDSWKYENFKSTSLRYAFINLNEELIQSNDLEFVERALFCEFLQYFNV
jgi:hypothetical protein